MMLKWPFWKSGDGGGEGDRENGRESGSHIGLVRRPMVIVFPANVCK